MSLDAITLRAVIDECRPLVGAKVIGLDQDGPTEVTMTLAGPDGRSALAISVHPEYARLYRAGASRGSAGASAFVTCLRDRLLGGIVVGLDAVPDERIAVVRCRVTTPDGECSYRLIAELLGRQSTLVFVDEGGQVVEMLRRVRTAGREVYPGERYEPPSRLDKTPLTAVREEDLAGVVAAETPESLVTRLVGRVGGLSPAMAREVVAGAGLAEADGAVRCSPDERRARLWASLTGVIDRVRTGRWTPMIGLDPAGQPGILSAIPLASLPPDRRIVCATMSEAIVRFYAARVEIDRVRQQTTRLRRVLADDVARLERLVVNLADDLAKAARGDEFRKYGDLLTAHLSVLRRGQPEAAVPDLYDPGQSLLRIPLDPALSPADNAKTYFKHAKKARDGRAIIERRLAQTRERLERVRTLRGRMEGEPDAGVVERVHRECVRWGLIREPRDGTKATGRPKPKRKTGDIHPRRFLTADGWVVLVGRNDRENEVLTKTAAPDDLWFHARGIGGSHVILRREGRKAMPSQAARYEAACVAAHFSKARGSTTVAVDYTERRYVRKQKDGRPGQVVFTHEKTLFVEPKLLKEQDSSHAAIPDEDTRGGTLNLDHSPSMPGR